jgi:tetratricopeptide (TPR) repeat protein
LFLCELNLLNLNKLIVKNLKMKNLFRPVTSLFVPIAAVFMYGCSSVDMNKLAKEQLLKVNPSPLELHGDSVKFEVSVVVPVKMLKKNKIYNVNVAYKSFDTNLPLGKLSFDGNSFPLAATEPPKLSQKFAFGFDKKIQKGVVTVVGEMLDVNKNGKKTPALEIAKGIITTPLMVSNIYPIAYADHGYDTREELTPNTVDFFFKKRISKLDLKETKTERGKYFEKFIASKYVTRTVNIVGTHSPEGAETVNEKLSEERAIAIEKYYRAMMKKFNYGKKADSITFVIKGKVKDWTDFKTKLAENKKLTDDQKSEITSIIDGSEGTFRAKEMKLQKLKSYKIIEKEIYPSLRNARTEVLTVKTKKTDAQIFLLSMKAADGTAEAKDSLSGAELLYGATLTPLPDEKEKIYLAATKKLDNYEAYNNLGALYLEKAAKEKDATNMSALVNNALTKLEIAKNRQETGITYMNIATAKLMKGDKAGAAEATAKAKGLQGNADVSKGTNGIQGVLDIKAGNYESAVTNLNSAGSQPVVLYDKGLALLLKKDFTAAKATFDDAISADDKYAPAYYCAAINAARSNDADSMNKYLKMAFKYDDTLKSKAVEDLEFLNFRENEKFKDALK